MIAVIVSESSIVLGALERSLEGSFSTIEKCTTLSELRSRPDNRETVIIFDINRPSEDVPAVLQMAHGSPLGRMIILTKETHDLREFGPLVGKVGAIMPHTSDLEEIALVARVVRAGLFLLPSGMISYLQPPKTKTVDAVAIASSLTYREAGVLALIAKGCSNKVIARNLGINDTTVRVHVRAVLRKIGVHNRTEAALFVMNHHEPDTVRAPGLPAPMAATIDLRMMAS
jgi:DNA-binding NarL/FixJ family response regulator